MANGFPDTLKIDAANLTNSEKAIIKLVMNGGGFQNPSTGLIQSAMSIATNAKASIDYAISSATLAGIVDPALVPGFNVTPTVLTQLSGYMDSWVLGLNLYKTHSDRISGVKRTTGSKPNFTELVSVAYGYNNLTHALKETNAEKVDNFTPFFSSILGKDKTIIEPVNNALLNINNSTTYSVSYVSGIVISGINDLITMQNTEDALYTSAIEFLEKFGRGMSIAGMASNDYPKFLLLNYTGNSELVKLTNNMIKEKQAVDRL